MLEPSIYGLWAGKQTARGTKNVAPSKRLVQVGGDFNLVRDDGEENFSDLTKYGARADWVNSVTATGEPAVECTPTELAYLLWLFHGAEVVTPVTGPPTAQKHTFTPTTGRGFWATFVKRIGLTQIQRQSFNDCLISRLQIEGSTAAKAVRITPRVLSLDPGEVIAADPAAAMPVDKTLLFTDGAGAFTLDGVAIPAHSQFTLVVDDDLSPIYGDDTVALDVTQGNAVVTIGVTLFFEALALARWNVLVYGTAAPVAGTKPLKTVAALGSYSFYLKQRDAAGALNGREFKLTIPGVKWAIPDSPGPNPDGGNAEVSFAGAMRPVSGQPAYTLDVNTNNADVAFTV